jgi:hypothetical protein
MRHLSHSTKNMLQQPVGYTGEQIMMLPTICADLKLEVTLYKVKQLKNK